MINELKEILLKARKENNKPLTGNMQILIAAIQKDEISKKRDLTDSEIYAHIRKSIKNSNDAIDTSNSKDVFNKEMEFQNIISSFLPKSLSVEEIVSILKTLNVKETDVDGKIIGLVMKDYRDVVSPDNVKEAIKLYKS